MNRIIQTYSMSMQGLSETLRAHLTTEQQTLHQHILIQVPEMKNNYGWLLSNGIVKQYRYSYNQEINVVGFWKKNDVILQPQSFLARQNAEDYVELIENSILQPFHYKDVTMLANSHPNLNIIAQIIETYRLRSNLHHQLQRMKVRDALHYLDMLYPLNRISKKDLASFLQINPSTLYRAGG